MLSSEVTNLLGLMARARKIVTGEMVIENIRNRKAHFVIIACDASDNTKKVLTDKCKSFHVEYLVISDSDTLSKAIGKTNRMAIGIMDIGFAKKLIKILKEGGLYGQKN